jgi:hypothetical protein
MLTLRCTHKLLARLKRSPKEFQAAEPVPPTAALGDWYAHVLLIERQHLMMLVSEPTRLCVMTTARDSERLPARFLPALVAVLETLDLPPTLIERECHEMREMCYGVTTGTPQGRSVLGSMNDYANVLRYGDFSGKTLPEWNLYFRDWLCGPLGYERPGAVARQRLLEAFGGKVVAELGGNG